MTNQDEIEVKNLEELRSRDEGAMTAEDRILAEALGQFRLSCQESQIIFEERNRMYGNSIESTGALGATVEIVGNVARLRKLVFERASQGFVFTEDEMRAVEDTLIDIHNYANIALTMFKKANWIGE